MKKPKYVLDSFALLAFFQAEHGGEQIRTILKEASAGQAEVCLSVINLGEIHYITSRRKSEESARSIMEDMSVLPIELLAATTERVLSAASVKARYSVSYADAFVIAGAAELSAKILTGDPEFKEIESWIDVLWL
ncbi:MAG: type II toxin-antitoxin system VapC family toxin [Desulfohalobiaceae bacterium]|nr:type II toxin-antitoxin system VapC family toxin [Desulfohalobiaceae bacterium]